MAKIEIDGTMLSILVVLGVLFSSFYTKNLRLVAAGAVALIVLFLMAKVIYFDLTVAIALVLLGLVAMFADDLQEFGGSLLSGSVRKDPNNTADPFVRAVRDAYAKQYAPFGKVITVDPTYTTKLFDRANVAEDVYKKLLLDGKLCIMLGGVETISDIRIYDDKPFDASAQIQNLISERAMWVKVKITDPETKELRDNIWVRVKAWAFYISPTNLLIVDESDILDGSVWNINIDTLYSRPLYTELHISKDLATGRKMLAEKPGLFEPEFTKLIATSTEKHEHYWPYDIAEV